MVEDVSGVLSEEDVTEAVVSSPRYGPELKTQ
jgi:hypothetical protein